MVFGLPALLRGYCNGCHILDDGIQLEKRWVYLLVSKPRLTLLQPQSSFSHLNNGIVRYVFVSEVCRVFVRILLDPWMRVYISIFLY